MKTDTPTHTEVRETKHVREVKAVAERVGLTLVKVTDRFGGDHNWDTGSTFHFSTGHYKARVTFDRRGYILSAGGNSPDANSWVIHVSGSRRFGVTPAQALSTLTTFTLPRYAKEAS